MDLPRPSFPTPRPNKRWYWVALIGLLLALAIAFLLIYRPSSARAPQSVGNEACLKCHADLVTAYAATAHARTSCLPSADTLLGDYFEGGNVMTTSNPALHFRMVTAGNAFTQSAVFRTSSGEQSIQQRQIAIIIGSGRKGQTYLHWDGDLLCQLPVSYWTEQRKWVNSPGYKDGIANFDRPIPPRCLECHATSAEPRGPPANRYDPKSVRLGLSCEKCHGPGEEHVRRYASTTPPRSPRDSAVVNPGRLSRDRQMDVCALCHAGEGRAITPPLTYRPGDVLSEHITFPRQLANAPLDVHASQVQLLQRSQCYRQSESMTCATCHNVHQPQRDLVSMAARCMQCHQVEACGKFASLGAAIARDCVNCHMPLEQTRQIVISGRETGTLQPKVRNHRIAVYPEAAAP